MNSQKNSKQFATLRIKGRPLVRYDAWDAGSAAAIVEVGAKAVGTASAELGVARVSYGPIPYANAMIAFKNDAEKLFR